MDFYYLNTVKVFFFFLCANMEAFLYQQDKATEVRASYKGTPIEEGGSEYSSMCSPGFACKHQAIKHQECSCVSASHMVFSRLKDTGYDKILTTYIYKHGYRT